MVQTDLAYLGRRVGTLLVANIVGSATGALLTGWLLLTWLGTSGTLRFLVGLSAIFPLLAVPVSPLAGTICRIRSGCDYRCRRRDVAHVR